MENSEETFLKELESVINPFLRDEISIDEYVVSSSGFSDTMEKLLKENEAGKQNNEVTESVEVYEQEKLMNPAAEHNKQDRQVCHTSLEPKNKRGAMATKPLAELVQESDGGKLNDRFSDPVRDIEEWLKPYIPRNTAKNTKWAYNNFLSWLKARNAADNPIAGHPRNLLRSRRISYLPFEVRFGNANRQR